MAARIGTTGGNQLQISVYGDAFIQAPLNRRASPALVRRPRVRPVRRGDGMSQLLYQGVEGIADESESIKNNACHPEQSEGSASRALPAERDSEDPKLKEECGVMAVYDHPDAARQVYLGLYALQHRGQESAGIASANGRNLSNIKGMGLVAEIFTDDVIAKLPGEMAIGHTRYSTTGDSALLNAQPIRVDSVKGLIAIAHNGNLVNLGNASRKTRASRRLFPDHLRLRNHRSAHRAFRRHFARRRHCRLARPSRGSLFDRHDDPRPHLRRPRSTWLPSAFHGPHQESRWSRHYRFCQRDLRLRPAPRRVRTRRSSRRTGHGHRRRRHQPPIRDRRAAVELHL